VGDVTRNLVADLLGGDLGNLVADTLVDLEVSAKLGVVPLDDLASGLLDGLGADVTLGKVSQEKEKKKRAKAK
jgi:hypothetical protein